MASIRKIFSGGQTGADRAALDVAIELGIPHGGWCPKGRFSENGKIPAKYALQETASSKYVERTEKNVVDSDATAVFTFGMPEGGSATTIAFAKKHKKPWRHFDLLMDEKKIAAELKRWIHSIKKDSITLNVAGSRESGAPGIYARTKKILLHILRNEISNG